MCVYIVFLRFTRVIFASSIVVRNSPFAYSVGSRKGLLPINFIVILDIYSTVIKVECHLRTLPRDSDVRPRIKLKVLVREGLLNATMSPSITMPCKQFYQQYFLWDTKVNWIPLFKHIHISNMKYNKSM